MRFRAAYGVSSARISFGDTEALGAALIARQFTLRGPGFLDDRLSAGLAVLGIAARLGDQDLLFRAHQWLVPDRFQAGALTEVAADVEQMAAIADARRNSLLGQRHRLRADAPTLVLSAWLPVGRDGPPCGQPGPRPGRDSGMAEREVEQGDQPVVGGDLGDRVPGRQGAGG